MKMNRLEKENKDKKIKEREKVSSIVLNKTQMQKNEKQKEILQDSVHLKDSNMIKENNSLSRDYRKERAEAKAQAIENLKKNMNLSKSSKTGVDRFEEMNNKLIKSTFKPDQ
jgi:hypothetical protein